eukprot:13812573-Alexandrium_andersonii.AAC.1
MVQTNMRNEGRGSHRPTQPRHQSSARQPLPGRRRPSNRPGHCKCKAPAHRPTDTCDGQKVWCAVLCCVVLCCVPSRSVPLCSVLL